LVFTNVILPQTTGGVSFSRLLGSTFTTTIRDISDYVGSRHLTIAKECRQVREVQHDARGSVLVLGEDCRAAIVGKEHIALGILRTKMVLGDPENVALGGSQRAAYHNIEVMCCLTNRA